MFTQLKEKNQYSFSIELSSKDIALQQTEELITYFDAAIHKEKEVIKSNTQEDIDLPLKIFNDGESGLKTIIHYLKDEKKISFSQIGKLLNRDQRTIWSSYNQPTNKTKSKNKKSKNELKQKKSQNNLLDDKFDNLFINTSLFKERKLSILETLAIHLLQNFSVKEVSELLGKNQMTIWTVKRRAEQKLNRKIISAKPFEKIKGGKK